jgi:4-hydroxy-4-methyl-2-oxoglutarate aldolase
MATATEPAISKDVIEAYRKFTLSTVWHFGKEAGLNCATGVARPIKREWKICGPAVTMRLIPIQDTRRYNDNTSPDFEHSVHTQVRLADPGDVIVLDMGGDTEYTLFGGTVAKDARYFGCEGAVIDGMHRDTEEILDVDFPMFSRGGVNPDGHGRYRTANLNNEAVRIGSISIAPGDLVLGDMDGIVVIPRDRVLELLPTLQKSQERHEEAYRHWKETGEFFDRNKPRPPGNHWQTSIDILDPKLVKNLIPGQWRRGEKPRA